MLDGHTDQKTRNNKQMKNIWKKLNGRCGVNFQWFLRVFQWLCRRDAISRPSSALPAEPEDCQRTVEVRFIHVHVRYCKKTGLILVIRRGRRTVQNSDHRCCHWAGQLPTVPDFQATTCLLPWHRRILHDSLLIYIVSTLQTHVNFLNECNHAYNLPSSWDCKGHLVRLEDLVRGRDPSRGGCP